MASALDKLIGLSLASITDAMSSPRWEREMERIIRTAHTAAFITATAERLGVTDPALISRARLSRAERQDIEGAVRRQLEYLRGFARARGGMSDQAALARARLYGPAIKSFYYAQRWGQWEVPDALLPGLQQCLGNCLCRIVGIVDNGDGTGVLTRVMGGTEHHCSECPPLAGDHPVKRRGYAEVKHGAHDQSSHGRRGRGGGGSSAGGGDTQRQIQNIERELASPYLSPGRRQALEARRGELMGGGSDEGSAQEQRLRNIERELASPYVSAGRRQVLEQQRGELLQQVPSPQVGPAPRSLRQEIDAAEAEIRVLPYEKAIFFGPDGQRLVQATGDATSYSLSERDFNSLRGVGATMTHNHPSGHKYDPSDPRHRGDSFSIQDIRQAAALGLSEVRAVTPTRRFWMKPPAGGWQDHHWGKTVPNAYKRHHSAVLTELVGAVRSGRLSQAEANARLYHEVWSRVAKDIGASYGYEDR